MPDSVWRVVSRQVRQLELPQVSVLALPLVCAPVLSLVSWLASRAKLPREKLQVCLVQRPGSQHGSLSAWLHHHHDRQQ